MKELRNKFFLLKDQISLLAEARKIRNSYRKLKLESFVYDYLRKFLKRQYWPLIILVVLLFSQGLIEAILIIFSRNQISNLQPNWLNSSFWPFLIFLILLFCLNSYFSIRREKTLGVIFANSIRKRIFSTYLNRPLTQMNGDRQSDLIAKISYQLPLASMGVANSFFSLIRWFIDILMVSLLAFWIDLNWFLILISLIAFSIIIAYIAYFISKSYIAQEVTFYSQILKKINGVTAEKYFLKIFNREKQALDKFDQLVDFDSFFRIRRDLWLKLSAKVLFIILVFLSVLSNFFFSDFFSWFNSTGFSTKFLYLFLLIYISRALYEILRVGLYLYPARLGLFLTVLKPNKFLRKEINFSFKEEIIFYGRKIKLYKNAKYWRHFNLTFRKGGRYLFYSPLSNGKSSLARTLAGIETFRPKTFKVKVDKKRLEYSSWQKFGAGICFFDQTFYSEKSIMEFILGQDKEDTNFSEIDKAIKVLMKHPLVAKLIAPDYNFNSSVTAKLSSNSSFLALYVASCLIKKPELIIIDNAWLDFDYLENQTLLSLLDKELPLATIIVFSRKDNDIFNYQEKHQL